MGVTRDYWRHYNIAIRKREGNSGVEANDMRIRDDDAFTVDDETGADAGRGLDADDSTSNLRDCNARVADPRWRVSRLSRRRLIAFKYRARSPQPVDSRESGDFRSSMNDWPGVIFSEVLYNQDNTGCTQNQNATDNYAGNHMPEIYGNDQGAPALPFV